MHICAALAPQWLGNKKLQDYAGELKEAADRVNGDPEKNVIVLAMLREQFGSDTLEQALNLLVACAAPVRTVNEPITDADLAPLASKKEGVEQNIDLEAKSETQPPSHIRILGWGSLLWGKDETSDKTADERHQKYREQHDVWECQGPTLPLEFSRVSSRRKGALTLVIDRDNGKLVEVSSARSRRAALKDAISDLREREEAENEEQIGYVDLVSGTHGPRDDRDTCKTVDEWAKGTWAKDHDVTAVIWSNFKPNFKDRVGESWSVENALGYIRCLTSDVAREVARKYIRDAPPFVRTPFREAAEEEEKKDHPWARP